MTGLCAAGFEAVTKTPTWVGTSEIDAVLLQPHRHVRRERSLQERTRAHRPPSRHYQRPTRPEVDELASCGWASGRKASVRIFRWRVVSGRANSLGRRRAES